MMNKSIYEVNKDIVVTYSKVPDKDDKWMGIYPEKSPQNIPVSFKALPEKEKDGSITFDGIPTEGN